MTRNHKITNKFWEKYHFRVYLRRPNIKFNDVLWLPFCLHVFSSPSIPQENISFLHNHILTSLWCIFNKLPLTNSCSTLPFFFVFLDIFTPLSDQWYIEMYEPIILLIKLSCPCYIYFPPNLLFHFSLLSLFLALWHSVSPSLSLGWPPWTFSTYKAERNLDWYKI